MYFITEDSIVDFIKTQKSLIHTRKFSNYKDFTPIESNETYYVCITGYPLIIKHIFENLDRLFKTPIILITIESDIIDFNKEYINHPLLKHWYSWNKSIKHVKISCIPIGLNKDRHEHNLSKVVDKFNDNSKEKLLLINFNPNTNPRRKDFFAYAQQNFKFADIVPYNKIPNEKSFIQSSIVDGQIKIDVTSIPFYEMLGNYKYVLSPPGTGIDCHRTWECIYLGVIPIVLSSEINELYTNLPILVVKDFKDITENMLNSRYLEIKKYDTSKSYINYWTQLFQIKSYSKTLINYANHIYLSKQKLNSRTAITHGGFDNVIEYNHQQIDKQFAIDNKNILSNHRGDGYWLWKPYFILKTLLENIKDNEYLMYADSGSFFVKPIDEVIQQMEISNLEIGCFEIFGHNDKTWTKRDTYIIMDADNEQYADSFQRMGGYQVIKKTENTLKFYKEYLKFATDFDCISDTPNKISNNYKEFRDHRHDQSIFSILTKKYNIKCLRDISHWQFESEGKTSSPGNYGVVLYGKNWQLVKNNIYKNIGI